VRAPSAPDRCFALPPPTHISRLQKSGGDCRWERPSSDGRCRLPTRLFSCIMLLLKDLTINAVPIISLSVEHIPVAHRCNGTVVYHVGTHVMSLPVERFVVLKMRFSIVQPDIYRFVIFEVFTAVAMKNGVLWDVTPCGSCKNRRFGGT
jgi:hypothetical protein